MNVLTERNELLDVCTKAKAYLDNCDYIEVKIRGVPFPNFSILEKIQKEEHIDSQWISRALDDLGTATSRLGQCIRDTNLDPTGDFEWIGFILKRLRDQLLSGKSTADMQIEAANEHRRSQ